YNTFGIEARARYFTSFKSMEDLKKLLADKTCSGMRKLLLGGGSNVLFTDDFHGLVLQNNIKGLDILEDKGKSVVIRVGAGENWDDLVKYTVDQGWCGLENLSYIPGSVGASPIQNIGAYGTEVKDTIHLVQTLNPDTLIPASYTKSDCLFDYRNSIFKNQLKNRRIITHVVFNLSRKPSFNLDYGILKETVRQKGPVNLKTIRQSVIEIRKSKLPEPEEVGNAGSFFKNPIVNNNHYKKLQSAHPDIPSYSLSQKRHKIPAGWMIDKLGWKGYREGDAGVHSKQALVLVNHGNATGRQIYELSQKIRESVKSEFGIELEYEVNII
ncbi:MAG: UDP-N-acetylmuramate dehydrogenase, partial [Bacteroidota bacterium]